MTLNVWKNRPEERWALRLVAIFSVAVALLLAADALIFSQWMEPRGGDLRPLARVTIFHADGSAEEDVSLTPVFERGDRAEVHVPIPRELRRPQGVLAFTAEHVAYRATWHGRILASYGMGDAPTYKMFGKVTRSVPIPEDAWGDEVVLELTALQSNAHIFISPVYLMDATTFWQYPLEGNLLCFLLFLSALVLLVVALVPLVLWRKTPFVRRGLLLALFSIVFIVWMIGYQGMMPAFLPDPYFNACLEYGALILLPVPFLCYLLNVETDPGRHRFYQRAFVWFTGLFLFSTFAQFAGILTYKATLPVLHFTLVAYILVLVWHRFHPLQKEAPWNILFRYGLTMTFASALFGMFQYYLFTFFQIPMTFVANRFIASGLLIFLLTVVFTYIYRFIGQFTQAQENRIYKRMALQDMLTCLTIRAGCFEAAKEIPFGAPYTVLFFDVNGLKEANDLYGHAAGDKLLRMTAGVLRDIFSPGATGTICARVGGDEFVIVVRDAKLPRLEALVRSVRDGLRLRAKEEAFPVDASVSCGISENDPARPKPFEEHIKIADDRMYAEKNRYKREKYGGRRAEDRVFLREETRKDDPS